MEFVLAVLCFVGSAVAYYCAQFLLAGLLGVGFWVTATMATLLVYGAVGATITLSLLVAVPVVFFAIHLFDMKLELFKFPTVYSLPVAYTAGLLQLFVTALAMVF